jgi:hypothetical protein
MAQHTCTVCGKKGEWSDAWSWYGSFVLMETAPGDLPKACSPECEGKMRQKIDSKEWQVPEVKLYGPNSYTVISERKGY